MTSWTTRGRSKPRRHCSEVRADPPRSRRRTRRPLARISISSAPVDVTSPYRPRPSPSLASPRPSPESHPVSDAATVPFPRRVTPGARRSAPTTPDWRRAQRAERAPEAASSSDDDDDVDVDARRRRRAAAAPAAPAAAPPPPRAEPPSPVSSPVATRAAGEPARTGRRLRDGEVVAFVSANGLPYVARPAEGARASGAPTRFVESTLEDAVSIADPATHLEFVRQGSFFGFRSAGRRGVSFSKRGNARRSV